MDRIASLISTNRKAVAGIAVVCVLFLVVVALYWKEIVNFWPSGEKIRNELSGLEKLHQELQKEIIEVQNIRQVRQAFIKQGKDFWVPKRDGDIESNIIKKVEEVAKSSGLKLQNIGNARPTKVNEDISFLEINIEAKASMEEISRFIAELYKTNPCFYWRKCVLRPFNPRDAKDIVLSGTLNVVSLTSDNVAKVLMGEEK
ncbi:MAG TPA: hypothetical protein DET40_04165 [Lentisphaeria bacterium]|nr:MAG: hypothetical protein A2X45_06415 [Lentisphaerae bacterium GWF2_50_93]HCE42721.1 hypothetical protein [Lentisphaeria bacterium]